MGFFFGILGTVSFLAEIGVGLYAVYLFFTGEYLGTLAATSIVWILRNFSSESSNMVDVSSTVSRYKEEVRREFEDD